VLLGSFSHSVDGKGRMFIPAKWREDLGGTIIVTRGILRGNTAHCLFGMSVEAWREFAARFSSLPETDVMGQAFRRMMFSNAADCEMDKQGRILIPNNLREYADLTREVTLVGVDNRIEIWNAQALQEHDRSMEAEYNAALDRLAGLGV